MKPDFTTPKPEQGDAIEDNRIPAFREASMNPEGADSVESGLFDKEKENIDDSDSSEPIITFGDELDVPAFIRNRRE